MQTPHLIYFADAMCSWCYGFSPVIAEIRKVFGSALPIQLIMGGLRPGTDTPMTDQARTELAGHWTHVTEASGLAFDPAVLDTPGFLYDTDPAARAVVFVRRHDTDLALTFLGDLQAAFYARHHGFGAAFESVVGRGMADFCGRLGSGRCQLWGAWQPGLPEALGGIAIDGEDLGEGRAHLRWFILAEAARGSGTGQRLLAEALAFVDAEGFSETRLWTLRGLDAARRLYEAAGFSLAEEFQGDQWGRVVTEQVWVRPRP